MFSGPGSNLDGLIRALYYDVGNLASTMQVTWQENMATNQ